MFRNIKSDIIRQIKSYEKTRFKKISAISFIQILLLNQGFHAILIYRFGQFSKKQIQPVRSILYLLYYVLEKLVNFLYGIHLSHEAKIGPGFYIGHFGGIKIGECEIGKQASVYQHVSININHEGHPIIGDKVWIGAHSHINNPISIGEGATIAAGSYLIEDIPKDSIAAGNPARVIKLNFDNSNIH